LNTKKLKALIPSYYTEEEKNEIILLLIDLANIYLNIKEEE